MNRLARLTLLSALALGPGCAHSNHSRHLEPPPPTPAPAASTDAPAETATSSDAMQSSDAAGSSEEAGSTTKKKKPNAREVSKPVEKTE